MRPVRFLNDADSSALAELYQQHAPALLTHLRLNVASMEDAEDLLLDIFVAALERDALRGLPLSGQHFWLWKVARNKLVDYYRRRSVRHHFPLEEIVETVYADDALAPDWMVLRDEEQRALLDAVEKLPPLQKEVLLLRFVNGMRAPEIARILGKRDAAIRMILSRTLSLLRKALGSSEDTK
jgi:RNA polymerase sigma factor (sigma-70 family)